MNIGKESNKLPKLGTPRVPFRDWETTILAYLGKKHLSMFLQYEITSPRLLKEDSSAREGLQQYLKEINNEEFYDVKKVKVYNDESMDTPLELMNLSMTASVVVLDKLVVPCYYDKKVFLKDKMELASKQLEVIHTLRRSMTIELVHYIDNGPTIFHGMMQIRIHYMKDKDTARIQAKRRLQNIQYRDLTSYINIFRKRFSEYCLYGGQESKDIAEDFIQGLPDDRFYVHKSMCNETTLAGTISFFLKVNANITLRCPEQKSRSNNVKVKVANVQNNKFSSTSTNPTRKKIFKAKNRCLKCGGFGHYIKMCPNKEHVCFLCGSGSHTYKNCTIQVIRVNTVDILEDEYASEDETSQNEECNAEENQVEEEYELNEYPTDVDYSLMTLNIQLKDVSVSKEKCTHRFNEQCLCCLVDSGATQHVTGNRNLLSNPKDISNVKVSGALHTRNINIVQGSLKLLLKNNTAIHLKNVVYIPGIKQTIISEPQLVDDNFAIIKDKKGARITKHDLTVAHLHRKNNHYILHCIKNPNNRIALNELNVSSSDLSHYRLGHLNKEYIKRNGYPEMKQDFCIGCSAGKLVQSRKHKAVQYSNSSLMKGTYPFEKLHTDTMGPFPLSFQNFIWINLSVCNYTGYLIPILTRKKDTISNELIKCIKKLQKQYDKPVKCIFSDNGTEFKNLDHFCLKSGIKREYSNAYQPSENGRIERQNRTVVSMMRALLFQSNLSERFWCFAAKHSCYILNRIAKQLSKSPFEIIYNIPPKLENIKLFGAKGFALKPRKSKLSTTTPIIYLGNDVQSKAYITLNLKTNKIQLFRTIQLDEIGTIRATYNKFISLSPKDLKNNIHKDRMRKLINKNLPHLQIQQPEYYELSDNSSDTSESPSIEEIKPNSCVSSPIQFNSKVSQKDQNLGNSTKWVNSEISTDNIIQGCRNRNHTVKKLGVKSANKIKRNQNSDEEEVYSSNKITNSTIPPRTYSQIQYRNDKQYWLEAYEKELKALEETGIFKVVDRPEPPNRVIPIVELFKSGSVRTTTKLEVSSRKEIQDFTLLLLQ
eukprot:snap_masked-scaffold_38-processed-gene-2.80-mRNA-1 protein AED:0.46 eAED:0.46 QI:0/0/0/0.5/1/1/2/0/1046